MSSLESHMPPFQPRDYSNAFLGLMLLGIAMMVVGLALVPV
jgi:hypothetical protein